MKYFLCSRKETKAQSGVLKDSGSGYGPGSFVPKETPASAMLERNYLVHGIGSVRTALPPITQRPRAGDPGLIAGCARAFLCLYANRKTLARISHRRIPGPLNIRRLFLRKAARTVPR